MEREMIRGALKNRYEGEKWDYEAWRGGNLDWKVVIGEKKEEVKKE